MNVEAFPEISPEHRELCRQVLQFDFDGGSRPGAFAARLAKENKWSGAYAQLVLDEYRKFVCLFFLTDLMVTPSLAVDQAWHLHLIYTESYWQRLCAIVGRPLHHHPGDGSAEDDARFAAVYERTLVVYRKFFGEPPPSVWGREQLSLPRRLVLRSRSGFRRMFGALSALRA